jgi:hypothetical protein
MKTRHSQIDENRIQQWRRDETIEIELAGNNNPTEMRSSFARSTD